MTEPENPHAIHGASFAVAQVFQQSFYLVAYLRANLVGRYTCQGVVQCPKHELHELRCLTQGVSLPQARVVFGLAVTDDGFLVGVAAKSFPLSI